MRHFVLLLLIFAMNALGQVNIYPNVGDYNRNLILPVDYNEPNGETFTLYYQMSTNFDYNRPSIIFFQDSQQQFGMPGEIDKLAKEYQMYDNFNVIWFQIRGRKYANINIKDSNDKVNWEQVYKLLSSNQIIEDIERVRQDIFIDHPESLVYMYGRSGGGYLIQEYLARYSKHIDKAFIRCAPNPLVMENLGYLESRHLMNSINSVDPTLHDKLKTIIERGTVPNLQLLWLLMRLGYGMQNPGEKQAKIINTLFNNNIKVFNSYMAKRGFDYKALKQNKKMIEQMGYGFYLRPLECDFRHLLGPEPDYVDPIYHCFRDLSLPVFELIERGKVAQPIFPTLASLKEIKTQIFYLAGKNDHMSPYQIAIELGKYIPNYDYWILDDNHAFLNHKETLYRLRNTFFKHGFSHELDALKNSNDFKVWTP